jgi:putative resolvase
LQGIHPQAAYRWFREGTLPVPAVRVNSRSVLVAPDAVTAPAQGGVGPYARVPSHDRGADLDRQVARLTAWAAQSGCAVVRVEAEKALRYAARDASPAPPGAVR